MSTDPTEEELLNYINRFTEKIKNLSHSYNPDEGKIDGETSNRGNKLKFGSTKVHRDKINGYNNDNEPIDVIHYYRANNSVLKRRRIDTYNYDYKPANDENDRYDYNVYDGDDIDSDENPYEDIDLEKILAPIGSPTDLVKRDSISKTYKSNVLRNLAQQAIELIEKEQETVIQISSLLDLFLGEDSNALLENDLQLPEYDHNLNLDETKKSEDNAKESFETDKRITRNQSIQEADPFFALPTMTIDPNLGLDPKVAEEARQLSQIALQRNEEFIRNLTTIRSNVVGAQTIKEKLYEWAKEMNGDPDESDIYQAEKEAASKAVQEAKTTQEAQNGNPSGNSKGGKKGKRGRSK